MRIATRGQGHNHLGCRYDPSNFEAPNLCIDVVELLSGLHLPCMDILQMRSRDVQFTVLQESFEGTAPG